jgi:hypothetical protein
MPALRLSMEGAASQPEARRVAMLSTQSEAR